MAPGAGDNPYRKFRGRVVISISVEEIRKAGEKAKAGVRVAWGRPEEDTPVDTFGARFMHLRKPVCPLCAIELIASGKPSYLLACPNCSFEIKEDYVNRFRGTTRRGPIAQGVYEPIYKNAPELPTAEDLANERNPMHDRIIDLDE